MPLSWRKEDIWKEKRRAKMTGLKRKLLVFWVVLLNLDGYAKETRTCAVLMLWLYSEHGERSPACPEEKASQTKLLLQVSLLHST